LLSLGIKKSLHKEELLEIQELIDDHATYCTALWNTNFHYDHYDSVVHTIYVRDLRGSDREKTQFRHLVEVEQQIQEEYGKRYLVGIIYEETPPE
tara:strand:- start:795 stop:1079 length:285 start_codon:yes stop_codon:yes gene_type:complete